MKESVWFYISYRNLVSEACSLKTIDFFSQLILNTVKLCPQILLWTTWLMFFMFHFPETPNKTIIFPLNTILVLKLSSFGDATSHPSTIWSGNRSDGNVSKILPVLFQWVPTTITPPVHRFADAYNFNNVVYQPSEYRDQENTCCHNYHWLTQKMLPKWQERVKKSTPIALNSNSKSLCDFQPVWVNP